MKTQTASVELSADSLFVAVEVGSSEWKLAFTNRDLTKVGQAVLKPGDGPGLMAAMAKAKRKLGLRPEEGTVSCYEAGRDGFWIDRFLQTLGVKNLVVDSSSILVDRRQRRAKTDGLDAQQLVEQLVRFVVGGGRSKVWKVVRAPTVDEEDARRLHRERDRLVRERGGHQTRIKALLALAGVRIADARKGEMKDLRQWDGQPLPPELRAELEREQERLLLVNDQLMRIEKERSARLKVIKAKSCDGSLTAAQRKAGETALLLGGLLGIGPTSSWLLAYELFWREYDNRRQVASATGLVPTPFNSGGIRREQGISKAGNPMLRKLLVEMAWSWLRYQPQSKLSRWFQARFAEGGSRTRRIGIVALARRLVVDLWRYVKWGVVPEGAAERAA